MFLHAAALRLGSQTDRESREYLSQVAESLDGLAFPPVDGGEDDTAVLLRGAAQIPLDGSQEAGYLVITMTRADFHHLPDGKRGSRNDLLLNRYWRPVYSSKTSLAPQLHRQPLAGEPLHLEGEEVSYRADVQEEMGLYAVLQLPQAINQSTRDLLTTATVSSVLVCVVISVLMCLRLSRQMFLPIQRLHSAISEVVQNNLDVYVPPYQDDELGQLAQRFNGMVAVMSTDLADILRFCISPGEFVPLRREVEILKRYMESRPFVCPDGAGSRSCSPRSLRNAWCPRRSSSHFGNHRAPWSGGYGKRRDPGGDSF